MWRRGLGVAGTLNPLKIVAYVDGDTTKAEHDSSCCDRCSRKDDSGILT